MEIPIKIFLLLLGFILLIKGSDYFVEGASALALKLGIAPITIGLSVVAFGTSSPELMINVFAAFRGNAGISFGNILGSNIINILLVLGIAGLFTNLKTDKNTIWREIPFYSLSILALFVLVNDSLLNSSSINILSRGDGFVLLILFAIFISYLFVLSKATADNTPKIEAFKTSRIVLFLIGGLLGLTIGGKLTVDSALFFSRQFGISDRLIGLTVVAIGSSLPEIFTTVAAARKGYYDIAVGNVIGSSIFNLIFILPVTTIITPLPFSPELNFDIFVMFLSSLFLFITMFTGKRKTIDRWEAILLILFYTVYLFFVIFIRGK